MVEITVYTANEIFNEGSLIQKQQDIKAPDIQAHTTTPKKLYAEGWVLKQCVQSNRRLLLFFERPLK